MSENDKIYDAYVSDEPTSREETLKVLREMVPKSIQDHNSRKLKERVVLLEYEKIKELLSLYYIFCGCSKPYCEACQIVVDFKLTV